MRTDWPPLDVGLETIIPFIFGKPLQWAEDINGRAACLPRFDDHWLWDRHDPEATFAELAKRTGFPCDPARHEQPWQMGRLWALPIIEAQSDNEDEIIVNRGLYVLWAHRAKELTNSLSHDDALHELQLMGEKLVHYYGSGNRVWRDCQSEQVKEWAKWLRCTLGCYDMVSGHLTDDGREVAALREFDMIGGAA